MERTEPFASDSMNIAVLERGVWREKSYGPATAPQSLITAHHCLFSARMKKLVVT